MLAAPQRTVGRPQLLHVEVGTPAVAGQVIKQRDDVRLAFGLVQKLQDERAGFRGVYFFRGMTDDIGWVRHCAVRERDSAIGRVRKNWPTRPGSGASLIRKGSWRPVR